MQGVEVFEARADGRRKGKEESQSRGEIEETRGKEKEGRIRRRRLESRSRWQSSGESVGQRSVTGQTDIYKCIDQRDVQLVDDARRISSKSYLKSSRLQGDRELIDWNGDWMIMDQVDEFLPVLVYLELFRALLLSWIFFWKRSFMKNN